MRTKVFLWTLMGCLIAPSIATAQDIYFSMGNEIRKLSRRSAPRVSLLAPAQLARSETRRRALVIRALLPQATVSVFC